MTERIKELFEQGLLTEEEFNMIVKALLKEDAAEVILETDSDSLGTIHRTICSFCGETLEFRRNSEVRKTFIYCYQCGTKLKLTKTGS